MNTILINNSISKGGYRRKHFGKRGVDELQRCRPSSLGVNASIAQLTETICNTSG